MRFKSAKRWVEVGTRFQYCGPRSVCVPYDLHVMLLQPRDDTKVDTTETIRHTLARNKSLFMEKQEVSYVG